MNTLKSEVTCDLTFLTVGLNGFFTGKIDCCQSTSIAKTDLVKKMIAKEGRSAINRSVPLNKVGETKDIAETALFLATKKSKYITGQVINVNGGLFLG